MPSDSIGIFIRLTIVRRMMPHTDQWKTLRDTLLSLIVLVLAGCGDASTGISAITPPGTFSYDDFTGTSPSSAWTVISRHGEYAQSETECNVPQMVSVASSNLTTTTQAQSATCGDFNIDGSVRNPPASWPYITGDVHREWV